MNLPAKVESPKTESRENTDVQQEQALSVDPGSVTKLLSAMQGGDSAAAGEFMTLVYDQLRHIAGRLMQDVPPGDTLQPTALVNEAYMKLVGKEATWRDRRAFFSTAAQAMRGIVVDQARRHKALKRGGDRKRVPLEEQIGPDESEPEHILALHEALKQYELEDREGAEIVMLRYFAGMNRDEISTIMGVSASTVDRTWAFARAWLHRYIDERKE